MDSWGPCLNTTAHKAGIRARTQSAAKETWEQLKQGWSLVGKEKESGKLMAQFVYSEAEQRVRCPMRPEYLPEGSFNRTGWKTAAQCQHVGRQ